MAEILLESGEFLDETFSPSLKKMGVNSYRGFIRTWKFHKFGVPAPTMNGDTVAYWLASVRDSHDELPVLAATRLPKDNGNEITKFNWNAGLIRVDFVEELSSDPLELHRACLDAALVSGPTSFNYAIEMFNNLKPADQIVLPKSVQQFGKTVIM
jgi:hypothetical protein